MSGWLENVCIRAMATWCLKLSPVVKLAQQVEKKPLFQQIKNGEKKNEFEGI